MKTALREKVIQLSGMIKNLSVEIKTEAGAVVKNKSDVVVSDALMTSAEQIDAVIKKEIYHA